MGIAIVPQCIFTGLQSPTEIETEASRRNAGAIDRNLGNRLRSRHVVYIFGCDPGPEIAGRIGPDCNLNDYYNEIVTRVAIYGRYLHIYTGLNHVNGVLFLRNSPQNASEGYE